MKKSKKITIEEYADHMLGIKINPELQAKGVGLAINKLNRIKR